jgi:protocatechuate 3,4-dioxygenase beta subunit
MATFVCVAMLLAGGQQSTPDPQAPAPSPATATIRGHVVAGDTGQPLRKAQVRLNQLDVAPGVGSSPFRENHLATTDADGGYEFKNLPAGRYNLFAAKGAYVGVWWGQQQPNQAGKPLDVLAGQTVERVDFTLLRGGVITGRVVDEFGEPLSYLQIGAMRAVTTSGRRDLQQMGFATTDDVGEFRMYGLMPGQYYVQARWRRMGPGDPTSPDRTGYPVTFFPGTTNAAEAQRFTVAAGQTISDLVMALSPIKTARVDGTVVDSQGRPIGNVLLNIMEVAGYGGYNMVGSSVRPDGTFTIASLPPGEYMLRTQVTGTRKEVAVMKLTVGTEDIKDLRLVALPPSLIIGRIVVDPAQAQALPTSAMSLYATDSELQRFGGMVPGKVADDLTFELSATPGTNRINAMNMPPGWTIRAIRVNTMDVTDEGIDVKAGENVTGVDVELTNKVTTISGLVTNARGEPAKDYTLIVFAADSKRWTPNSRYQRVARPDQDGRFKINSLPAGDYNIIAIDRVDPGQVTDPDFLQRVQPNAKSLFISEGETKTVDLRITTDLRD